MTDRPGDETEQLPAAEAAVDAEFAAFLAGHHRRLLHLARLVTGDHHAGEDLLQTVLARTYLSWRRRDVADAYAYTRRALANAATDRWRRRGRVSEVSVPDVPELPERGSAAAADGSGARADRDALLRALRELPPRMRAVVVLRYFEDLSEAETAAVLGVRPGTVKSASSRALARLAQSPHLASWAATSRPVDRAAC